MTQTPARSVAHVASLPLASNVANARQSSLAVEVVRDVEAFRALREEWTALLDACACKCLFLSWEWMFTWWLHLAGKRRLHIILVRRDGLLIALAPLALAPSRHLGFLQFRMLEFIASGSVGSDYLSILVRQGHEDAALAQVAACLADCGHVVEFVRVEKSSYLMVNLVLQLQAAGWQALGVSTNFCPYATLAGLDWESYLQTLQRSHRSDVVKKLKKLHKEFAVDFRTAASEDERKLAMQTFVRLHIERWAKHGGSNALNSKELVDFHEAISAIALQQGWLRMQTLMLDGVAAAALYVFQYHGTCYYYQAAFNPDYARYSVGVLMLALCIRSAIAEGATEFDFLHDDEEYKYLWSRQERELLRLELFPPRSIGHMCRQTLALKGGIKRLLGTVQPLLPGSSRIQ